MNNKGDNSKRQSPNKTGRGDTKGLKACCLYIKQQQLRRGNLVTEYYISLQKVHLKKYTRDI